MHGVFDEDELQQAERRPDTELTLGPMLLLSLFFGLVLLCGLCFGLGYSMGSHNARGALTAVQQTSPEASAQPAGSLSKPSAVSQNISQPMQTAAAGLPPTGAPGANSSPDSQPSGAASVGGANSAQPVVKPALPEAATAPAPAPAPTSVQPSPALRAAGTGATMVQIAIFPHQEDADVLVSALRKRGYAVIVHRDAADNQFHVRTGPFSNRNEANAMRQKLLNDGYNAIVQP